MRKTQGFQILKISSERIREEKYNLNISYEEAVKNQEMVSLSDSQLIRTINNLKNSKYSQVYLNSLLEEKKSVSRKKNSKENKNKIARINRDIQDILYIPEIVSISFTNKKHTKKIIENGFILNSKKYSAFMASSGMVRRNTTLFLEDEIINKLEPIFDNGRSLEKEMIPVKFGVYYSLYSSSSLEVTFPRIAIIKDRIYKDIKNVEFAEIFGENKMGVDPKIEPRQMEIEFNSFDGQGLVSPKFAKIWSSDLEIDYIPSAFIVRASYLKGLCVTFDFHKFAKENNVSTFIDIYGNVVKVSDIDVIISESQFKLWSSYSSTKDYLDNCEKNNLGWGITRVTPKEDKNSAFSSYQFIQSLAVEDEGSLCEPTVNWLSLLGKSRENILAYLLGDIEYSDGWFDRLDYNTQALLLEESLIKDAYFLRQVSNAVSKRKKESCMGKLVFPGNYQFLIADPYAQCCHIFGVEFKHLLMDGECYSKYWNDKESREIAIVRSPNVHSSEIDKVRLSKEKEAKDWFKYIYSGIVFPPYGVSLDMAILAGGDHDGDIAFSTNFKPFVEGKQEGKPIFYDVKTPQKEIIKKREKTIEKQSLGMGSKVGFLTNYGSTLATFLSNYIHEDEEYNILNQRYKYIRVAQGLELDKQKGLIIPEFPEWWTKSSKEMSVFEKSLVVEKRPYFFKYLYEHFQKRYNDEFLAYDNISRTIYNIGIKELMEIQNPTKDQRNLIETYKKESFFIDNNSIMNRVSHYMEDKIKEMSKEKIEIAKDFDYRVLLSKNTYKPNKSDLEKMQLLFKEYKSLKRALRENIVDYGEENYSSLDQIKKYINNRAYETINSNAEELGNLVVWLCYNSLGETSRKFAWDCFGKEISENIKNKRTERFVRVPVKNKKGSFEYLFDRYGIYLMNL